MYAISECLDCLPLNGLFVVWYVFSMHSFTFGREVEKVRATGISISVTASVSNTPHENGNNGNYEIRKKNRNKEKNIFEKLKKKNIIIYGE